MTDALISPAIVRAVVRERVGRRSRISRQEAADLLVALAVAGLDLRNDCVHDTWDYEADPGGYLTPVAVQSPGQIARAARVWANAIQDITVISILPRGCTHHGQVRYDEPGRMAPLQHAMLALMSASQVGREHDPIGYMRRHADRVLIVADEPPLPDPIVTPEPTGVPQWITQLRRLDRVDGTWVQVHDDGTLEMRDPNSGQSREPADKPRYQYRVDPADGEILKRCLPPERVGDAWADIGVPEWEPSQTPPRDDLMYRWWEAQVL